MAKKEQSIKEKRWPMAEQLGLMTEALIVLLENIEHHDLADELKQKTADFLSKIYKSD